MTDIPSTDGMGLLDHPSLPTAEVATTIAPRTERPVESFLEAEKAYVQERNRAVAQLKLRDDKKREYAQTMNASSSSIWSAAFVTENTLGSAISSFDATQFVPVDGYNPFDKREDGSTDIDGYEQFYEAFSRSTSPEQTAHIKSQIDNEMQNRQILANGGAEGFLATLAAGVTDPVNLAALMFPVARGAQISSYVYTGLAANSAAELGLHSTQITRTPTESAANIIGSAVLDGVLGGIANTLTKTQREAFTKEIAEGRKSAGAAAVLDPTGTKIDSTNPLSRLAATMTKVTPLGRTLQSESKKVRQTVQQLAESGVRLAGDTAPTSVESLVKLDYAKSSETIIKVRDLQNKFIRSTGLTDITFNTELVAAMRRGDKSQYPEIEQAAQFLRKSMDGLWESAAKARVEGTFRLVDGEPEPIRTTTSESYMTRRYDLNVVRNDPEGFKRAWMDALADQRAKDGKSPLDPSEMYEVANDIYDKVINLRLGDLHYDVGPSGAAQTKARVEVADHFLEAYLVKDWETLFEGYVKSLAPRVRMAETFGDFRMKDQIDAITDEYSLSISRLDKEIGKAEGAERNKLVKEKGRIVNKMQSEIRDLEIMRDRIMNVPQDPSMMNPENRGILSALRAARSWNIVTSLSNMLISSIPDMARLITYNGADKFARAFSRSALSREISRSNLPKNELAKIASAMERASAYRLANITEVEDGVVYTRADKYAHKAADMVLTASGSKHWNSVTKTIAGYLFGDRVGRALVGRNADDISKLKQIGLDGEILSRARQQAKKHGFDDDGLFNPNLERWEDRELVETIEAAAIREADLLVVTPSAGDKPIMFTSEVGRTIFQFKSFMLAATNRLALPLAQEGGVRPWAEIMTHIGLGMGVYALKQKIADREIADDPLLLTTEAVENTGLAGYAVEFAKAGATLTGYNPLESEDNYQSHVSLVGILGPTAAAAESALRIPNSDSSAEARAKAVRKLMPMQNHFVLRKGYDEIEKDLAKLLGGKSQNPEF